MWWREFVGFLRGTRPRPPPGPKSPRGAALLVIAALCQLPVVYMLVSAVRIDPPLPLGVGLLSIGLAWSGGCALEGRRAGTVRAFAALAVAEAALAFVPSIASSLGGTRWLLVAASGLALGALAFGAGKR